MAGWGNYILKYAKNVYYNSSLITKYFINDQKHQNKTW